MGLEENFIRENNLMKTIFISILGLQQNDGVQKNYK